MARPRRAGAEPGIMSLSGRSKRVDAAPGRWPMASVCRQSPGGRKETPWRQAQRGAMAAPAARVFAANVAGRGPPNAGGHIHAFLLNAERDHPRRSRTYLAIDA